MTFNPRAFLQGIAIGTVFIASSLFYSVIISFFKDIRTIEVVAALAGGFSAGLFTYIYEKKRRTEEKRTEKYYEHRNALVRIEHELSEARVLMSRNISSLENTLEINDRYRLILRFFPIPLTRGLNLKILNIDLINKYTQLLSQLDLINSDFEYTKELVLQIRSFLQSSELQISNPISQSLLQSLLNSYIQLITNTNKLCLLTDNNMMDLLAMCTIAINQENEPLIKHYIKNPKQVIYKFSKQEIERTKIRKQEQEARPGTEESPRPQFVAPFMDVLKVIPTPGP